MKHLFRHLKGDLFGGITAGIVALPLALAFGVQSGLGPDAGLYGAIMIGFFASLFGGTNTQISGPTAPMTAVSMVVIAGIITANDGDVAQALPAILLVFMLAGIMQILLGILKLGRYIHYIPYPVVSGFMTAIGVIILATQFLPLLGYYVNDDKEYIQEFVPEAEEIILNKILKEEAGTKILELEDFKATIEVAQLITPEDINKEAANLAKAETSGVMGALLTIPRAIRNVDYLELILALLTIIIIYGFKRITTVVPSTLVALLVVSSGAYFMGVDYRPIQQIPGGFPMPNFGIFADFKLGMITPYIFTALTLALLGCIDSLLTSVIADNMTKTKHDPDRELVGQGIGNSVAALFGGLPGAGATIRTVVNIKSGGKTKLSGMTAAVLLLIILLALGPIASMIPAAVLAGILITVGIGVMDYKGLKAIPYIPRTEVVIMIVVLLLATFWNLVYAVGIGLVIASLVFMKKMGDIGAMQSTVLRFEEAEKEKEEYKDEKPLPEELKREVFIKRLQGPLFFGYTEDFHRLSREIPATASHLIIRMGKVPYIDQTGLYALEEVILKLKKDGVEVLLTGLQKQPRYLMERIDIVPDLVSEDHIFESFRECITFVRRNVEDKYPEN